MIVIPASLRSDFIHIAGMPIHIPLESTIHIAGIRTHGNSLRGFERFYGLFPTVDSPVRYLRDMYVHSEDI
jgi:hypothetical protein